MNSIPLLASAASAVVVIAAQSMPAYAISESAHPSAPVAVEACRTYMMGAGKSASHTNTIEIAFRDDQGVAARAVDFNVNWGSGDVQAIHDVGTFSPGVSVRHKFVYTDPNASSLFPNSPVTCEIEAVRFADGSVWHAGSRTSSDTRPAGTQSARRIGQADTVREERDGLRETTSQGRVYPNRPVGSELVGSAELVGGSEPRGRMYP